MSADDIMLKITVVISYVRRNLDKETIISESDGGQCTSSLGTLTVPQNGQKAAKNEQFSSFDGA